MHLEKLSSKINIRKHFLRFPCGFVSSRVLCSSKAADTPQFITYPTDVLDVAAGEDGQSRMKMNWKPVVPTEGLVLALFILIGMTRVN